MHRIGGLLGFAGCSEDRARVILEKANVIKGGQPLTSDFSVITEKGVTTSSD
jgi:hypothetical protein